MPPSVAHWPDVKNTAIATGNLKEAADAHGIEYGAVRVRAHREEWPVGRRVHRLAQEAKELAAEQIIKASGGTVTSVTSTCDALQKTILEHGNATRLAGMKYARRTAERAADLAQLNPDEALAQASNVKAVLQTAALAGDWAAVSTDQSTHLNFFQIANAPDDPGENPVFDVAPSDDPDDY